MPAGRPPGGPRPGAGAQDSDAGPCYGSPVFGLGMMEIGLVVALAVMLFPPKELPKLARMIARVYGQVRKTADDFRSAVLEDEDLRAPIDEVKGAYNDARWEVRDAERKARQQLAKAQMEMRMATARRLQAEREAQAQEQSASAEAGEAGAHNDPVGLPRSHEVPIPATDPRRLTARPPAARPVPRVAEAGEPGPQPVAEPGPEPLKDAAPSNAGTAPAGHETGDHASDEAREGVA